MYDLSASEARAFVRKSLDEVEYDTSMFNTEDTDNQALNDIIDKCMAEAVRDIHLAAPAVMLEGLKAEEGDYEIDGNLISMVTPMLRLVSFKASDSDYVVSELVAEDSPEGHQQLDPYTRGTYDDPRMVLLKSDSGSRTPSYRYYSFNPQDENGKTIDLVYIPYPEEDGEEVVYQISTLLKYHTLNYLTGLVLDILGEAQRSQLFYQRAAFVKIDEK